MATPDIPLIDISAWRTGGTAQRERLAERLDRAMRDSGFFLVSGHGIPPELLAGIRSAAGRFFALPREAKARYRTHVGGRGWIAKGDEANSFYGVDADPAKADLKETFTAGRDHTTSDTALDAQWFLPNVWPAEVPELAVLGGRWADAARKLYDDLLEMLATALRLPEHFFRDRTRNSPHTFNINRYPAMDEVGTAQDGQFRVAPHTDWGMLTILDRQTGYGGLQVQPLDGDWAEPPTSRAPTPSTSPTCWPVGRETAGVPPATASCRRPRRRPPRNSSA
ncbi:2-oxoglutarate and iron-dependent oxygenase domain-containing protein [Streptomyces sp. NPDC047072]|uniref:isopenicillin N synthase family dioxygenase n=1 Tax=Streptomyces sp. NPDC047072 TaxID=3154809 RepID=UPI0034074481